MGTPVDCYQTFYIWNLTMFQYWLKFLKIHCGPNKIFLWAKSILVCDCLSRGMDWFHILQIISHEHASLSTYTCSGCFLGQRYDWLPLAGKELLKWHSSWIKCQKGREDNLFLLSVHEVIEWSLLILELTFCHSTLGTDQAHCTGAKNDPGAAHRGHFLLFFYCCIYTFHHWY